MRRVKEKLERDFICPKCRSHGATGEEVTLPNGALSRMLPPLGSARYIALSCGLCGYTELYNLALAVRSKDKSESPEADDLVEGVENA